MSVRGLGAYLRALTMPILACLILGVSAGATTAPMQSSVYEEELITLMAEIERGDVDVALEQLDQHLARYPKSRVGHLMRADLLGIQAGGKPVAAAAEISPAITPKDTFDIPGLRKQLAQRWQHRVKSASTNLDQRIPAALVHTGEAERVLVADMNQARLYLYDTSGAYPKRMSDYYLSVGSQGVGKEVEGDNRTPIGVYKVTQYIDDSALPDLYGSGAFPVNYPNRYDRLKGRTGYGIWLHGTPSDTVARAPWSSEGCFVLSNEDFEQLRPFISVDAATPVVLADAVTWLTPAQYEAHRDQYLAVVDHWRQTWERIDTDGFIALYDRDVFDFGAQGYEGWVARKRAVNAGKTFINVDLNLLGLYLYPGPETMFVVEFEQRYNSNNYRSDVRKQQYWQRGPDGQWRIIYEGQF